MGGRLGTSSRSCCSTPAASSSPASIAPTIAAAAGCSGRWPRHPRRSLRRRARPKDPPAHMPSSTACTKCRCASTSASASASTRRSRPRHPWRPLRRRSRPRTPPRPDGRFLVGQIISAAGRVGIVHARDGAGSRRRMVGVELQTWHHVAVGISAGLASCRAMPEKLHDCAPTAPTNEDMVVWRTLGVAKANVETGSNASSARLAIGVYILESVQTWDLERAS